jgi:transposase-like protein
MNKTAVYKWVTRFSEGRESVTEEESQEHSRASKHHRETVRKILTEDLDMRKVCVKMVPKDLLTRHCL